VAMREGQGVAGRACVLGRGRECPQLHGTRGATIASSSAGMSTLAKVGSVQRPVARRQITYMDRVIREVVKDRRNTEMRILLMADK
jgi:hypothetical protein